jgi:hypothetical protein
MQTLEPPEGHEFNLPDAKPRRRRPPALLATGLVVVVVAALVAYALGSSQSQTKVKTVVKTVTEKPAASVGLKCVQGAAAGSCNTDEAAALLIPDQPLSAATRATLAKQLVEARAAAMRYPTVADAQRAHMLQAGQFSPETGAHFINLAAMVPHGADVRYGAFDAANPASLIYDGTSPASKVIGVMYLSLSVLPPEGFAGPNDHWHRHTNTCVEYQGSKIVVPFAADSDVTEAACAALHGSFMRETAWMVHAWVVPSWESPNGVFSHDNSDVKCANGTIKTDAIGFCQGT